MEVDKKRLPAMLRKLHSADTASDKKSCGAVDEAWKVERKLEVDDAVKPLVSCNKVVVAEVFTPYWDCWVKGHAKVDTVAQEMTPAALREKAACVPDEHGLDPLYAPTVPEEPPRRSAEATGVLSPP